MSLLGSLLDDSERKLQDTMCDQSDMDEYISTHNLDHVANEVAPWFCTDWPINHFDRCYWSYNHSDGTVWVSRTLAQRGKPIDPLDRCVICQSFL